jgi:hypothetical protein
MNILSKYTPEAENGNDSVEPEVFSFSSSRTKPVETQESVPAEAEQSQGAFSLPERSVRPTLYLFFPSWESRIEASHAWAIIERVM